MYEGPLGLKKPIFGLDIGYQTLKVMQLSGDGPGAKLLAVSEVPIPAKSLNKDGIKDKQKIAEAIVEAMKQARPHPISARMVSSALPESLVFTKSIDLPQMKTEEINKAVPYQAGEFLPIPPNEMYLDWHIVGSLPGEKSVDVLLVATPKTIVNSLVETVKLAGLELVSLETKPVAATRALIAPNDQGSYLLLDIGAKTSSIICFDQATIKLTSTISTSAEELAKNFQENIKILSTEIHRLIKYYQNRIGRNTVFHQILLAGGGANTPDIAPVLEKATKIPAKIGWPIIKTKTYNPKYATVIGLAMKKI